MKFTFDGEIRVRVRAFDRVAVLQVTDTRAAPVTRHVPIVLLSARAGSAEKVAGAKRLVSSFRGRGPALIRSLGELTLIPTDRGTELTLRRRLAS